MMSSENRFALFGIMLYERPYLDSTLPAAPA
jgi:hypothetical protein